MIMPITTELQYFHYMYKNVLFYDNTILYICTHFTVVFNLKFKYQYTLKNFVTKLTFILFCPVLLVFQIDYNCISTCILAFLVI